MNKQQTKVKKESNAIELNAERVHHNSKDYTKLTQTAKEFKIEIQNRRDE